MARRRAKIIDTDKGWARIKREIERSGKPHVRVGIFGEEAAKDHGGRPNVVIAAAHELGTDTIPERSFIRATVDAKSKLIAGTAKRLAAAVIAGTQTHAQALNVLGQFVRGLMQERITANIPPPLKPATIKRKGSSTPLIDTGQLRASIDYETKNA
jgi:phage gpG-like protein